MPDPVSKTAARLSLGLALGLALGLVLVLAPMAPASAQRTPARGNPCGVSPGDWCASPPGDACGRHASETACRADPRCMGLPYRGESVVPCVADGRGFSGNCPAVGCVTAPGRR